MLGCASFQRSRRRQQGSLAVRSVLPLLLGRDGCLHGPVGRSRDHPQPVLAGSPERQSVGILPQAVVFADSLPAVDHVAVPLALGASNLSPSVLAPHLAPPLALEHLVADPRPHVVPVDLVAHLLRLLNRRVLRDTCVVAVPCRVAVLPVLVRLGEPVLPHHLGGLHRVAVDDALLVGVQFDGLLAEGVRIGVPVRRARDLLLKVRIINVRLTVEKAVMTDLGSAPAADALLPLAHGLLHKHGAVLKSEGQHGRQRQ
mmetsp:Transcript_1135/g.2467  ORF Transcript_1135/g.2467 Transcript_1135/m.2467 type:complete len:257 (-) Transcript_1135:85-855(-)